MDVQPVTAAQLQLAQHRTTAVYIVIGVFLGAAWIAVALRTWVRAWMIKSFGPDDWAMLVTAMIFTAYCGIALRMNMYNPDLMLDQVTWEVIQISINQLIGAMALYIATTVAFKFALGLFYLRITTGTCQRYTIMATMTVSTVYGIAFLFFTVFQCGNPVHFLRNQLTGQCTSRAVLLGVNLAAGIVNALTDWILALLPISLLLKSSMPRIAKLSAGGLIFLGAIGSLCSVIRLVYLHSFNPGPHFFWTMITLTIWSLAECGICIIAASMAALRPLFRSCMNVARALTPAKASTHGTTSTGIVTASEGSRLRSGLYSKLGSFRQNGNAEQTIELQDCPPTVGNKPSHVSLRTIVPDPETVKQCPTAHIVSQMNTPSPWAYEAASSTRQHMPRESQLLPPPVKTRSPRTPALLTEQLGLLPNSGHYVDCSTTVEQQQQRAPTTRRLHSAVNDQYQEQAISAFATSASQPPTRLPRPPAPPLQPAVSAYPTPSSPPSPYRLPRVNTSSPISQLDGSPPSAASASPVTLSPQRYRTPESTKWTAAGVSSARSPPPSSQRMPAVWEPINDGGVW